MKRCCVALLIFSLLVVMAGCDNSDNPDVQIISPKKNSTFIKGDEIRFRGKCKDNNGNDLSGDALVWHSNMDGEIGSGKTFVSETLSSGNHKVTLTCTDDNDKEASESIKFTIKEPENAEEDNSSENKDDPDDKDAAATSKIVKPEQGSDFATGDDIAFEGECLDKSGQPLAEASLKWSSDVSGEISTEKTFISANLSAGTQKITLTCTDAAGTQASTSIEIIVRSDDPGNSNVEIVHPEQGGIFAAGDTIAFEGNCKDSSGEPVVGDGLVWMSGADGEIGTDERIISDTLSTGSQRIELTCTDDKDVAQTTSVDITVYAADSTGKVADTGQVSSYTDTPGEDSDYNTTHQPAYVKLDAQGTALNADTTAWVMVKDAVTGLVWQVKTDEEGVHNIDNQYSWDEAQEMIDTLNQDKLGGYDDWRLPTIKELSALILPDEIAPLIKKEYFPHNKTGLESDYWSSTAEAGSENTNVWKVNFETGDISLFSANEKRSVRVVRGEQKPAQLQDNGDGTVTDMNTGLMWLQDDDGKEMTWEDALDYCENLDTAGHDDWRLPNRNELISIVHYEQEDAAADIQYFPKMMSSNYWSSTTYKKDDGQAYLVNFQNGELHQLKKSELYYVRPVRSNN